MKGNNSITGNLSYSFWTLHFLSLPKKNKMPLILYELNSDKQNATKGDNEKKTR